jgi:hypothetical protein
MVVQWLRQPLLAVLLLVLVAVLLWAALLLLAMLLLALVSGLQHRTSASAGQSSKWALISGARLRF